MRTEGAHRLAILLQQLAELDRQRADLCMTLAEELLEGSPPAVDTPPRRGRGRPKLLPPEQAPSEVDIARARRALRRAGLVGVKA